MSKNNPVMAVMISNHGGGIWLCVNRSDEKGYRTYHKYDWEKREQYGTFMRRCFSALTIFNANGLNGNLKFNALKDD